MKKIFFALIGLSMLFASCSDVNTKAQSLLYAERIDSNTAVIHNGTMKDTIKIGNTFKTKVEKDLSKIEVGKGVVLVPENDGGYKVVGVRKMEQLEDRFSFGIFIGMVIMFLLIALIVFIFDD